MCDLVNTNYGIKGYQNRNPPTNCLNASNKYVTLNKGNGKTTIMNDMNDEIYVTKAIETTPNYIIPLFNPTQSVSTCGTYRGPSSRSFIPRSMEHGGRNRIIRYFLCIIYWKSKSTCDVLCSPLCLVKGKLYNNSHPRHVAFLIHFIFNSPKLY